MGKLHELLAVEEDIKKKCNLVAEETLKTFKDKPNHFVEQLVVYKPYSEDEKEAVEGQMAMVTTVTTRLAYTLDHLAKFLDAGHQKEKTNTVAQADVTLPCGTVLAKAVPATSLLFLERELGRLYDLCSTIPTLEPGVPWKDAADRGAGIVTSAHTKIRTKKTLKAVVLYQATKEHPAQVEKVSEDVPAGEVQTTLYSSKWTSGDKANLIERLDTVRKAIKKARMRANSVDVIKDTLGKKITDYVLSGKLE